MPFVDPFNSILRLTASRLRATPGQTLTSLIDDAAVAAVGRGSQFMSYTMTVNDHGVATIRCVVPGVGREDIQLVAHENGVLSITLHGKTEYRVEFDSHNFNHKQTTAECKNGILTVTLQPVSQASDTGFVVPVG